MSIPKGELEPGESPRERALIELEWHPRSGRRQSFPEVDRAEWFGIDEARRRINPAQAAFLDRL